MEQIALLLEDIKLMLAWGIASMIACFVVLLIAIYAKGWK